MFALVTGAGGFLGQYIVEQLLARGDRVRALGRARYPELDRLGAECVTADVRDDRATSAACAGVDVVFHAAAVAGIWGPWNHYYGINCLGTSNSRHSVMSCLARHTTQQRAALMMHTMILRTLIQSRDSLILMRPMPAILLVCIQQPVKQAVLITLSIPVR